MTSRNDDACDRQATRDQAARTRDPSGHVADEQADRAEPGDTEHDLDGDEGAALGEARRGDLRERLGADRPVGERGDDAARELADAQEDGERAQGRRADRREQCRPDQQEDGAGGQAHPGGDEERQGEHLRRDDIVLRQRDRVLVPEAGDRDQDGQDRQRHGVRAVIRR